MSVQSAKAFVKDCLRKDDIAALRAGLGEHIPYHDPDALDILFRRFERQWSQFRTELQEEEMNDTIPIPLPRKMLWKVRLADDLSMPKTTSVLLITGASSVFDAATRCKKTEGWRAFVEQFPKANVTEVIYSGVIETQL